MPVVVALVGSLVSALWKSKRTMSILAAIIALGALVRFCFGWLWEILWEFAFKLVLNLFDPFVIVDFAFNLLGSAFSGISWLFPGEVAAALVSVGEYISDVSIGKGLGVLFWFLNPICPATTIMAALRSMMLVWVATSVTYLVLRTKHEIPGGGGK